MAASMALLRLATWLEAVSFVTGAVCVWLTVKQNIWNFPLGLINVATFCVVFYKSRLFADAGLQVVYFILGVLGWYLWLRGGRDNTPLKVARASVTERAAAIVFAVLGTMVLWQFLEELGGSASFWDALTTSISLSSQWLLNRKRLESWIGWIIVDAIYIPLYTYKELYLTAILYAVFLAMAGMGWQAWRVSWREQSMPSEMESSASGMIS
jgi:nicotinamide mononucleotide transporter